VSSTNPTPIESGTSGGQFRTTHWSTIQAASDKDGAAAEDALIVLCESYWYPLYTFLRRRGHDASEAGDLTQGFFARLLEKRDFATANPEKGRFRAFLLTALKNYVANDRERERAEKRGGNRNLLSFDVADAEDRYAIEPVDERTPEDAFARNWAVVTMGRAFERVRDDYERANRMELYQRLVLCMTDAQSATHRELGKEVGMNESAFKVAVHRVRKRFRECLRREIAETLNDESEVEDELQALYDALSA
jgi:RNA polymerase sigma factor (sigma-70 family)